MLKKAYMQLHAAAFATSKSSVGIYGGVLYPLPDLGNISFTGVEQTEKCRSGAKGARGAIQ